MHEFSPLYIYILYLKLVPAYFVILLFCACRLLANEQTKNKKKPKNNQPIQIELVCG